jgi:hypothetical protein
MTLPCKSGSCFTNYRRSSSYSAIAGWGFLSHPCFKIHKGEEVPLGKEFSISRRSCLGADLLLQSAGAPTKQPQTSERGRAMMMFTQTTVSWILTRTSRVPMAFGVSSAAMSRVCIAGLTVPLNSSVRGENERPDPSIISRGSSQSALFLPVHDAGASSSDSLFPDPSGQPKSLSEQRFLGFLMELMPVFRRGQRCN